MFPDSLMTVNDGDESEKDKVEGSGVFADRKSNIRAGNEGGHSQGGKGRMKDKASIYSQ